MPSFETERMPVPILKKKDRKSYFEIELSENGTFVKSEYKVYIKYIVDIDSIAKCLTIIKSEEPSLNIIAIDRINNLKFFPAKRNGSCIPYFSLSIFIFKKKS